MCVLSQAPRSVWIPGPEMMGLFYSCSSGWSLRGPRCIPQYHLLKRLLFPPLNGLGTPVIDREVIDHF